MIQYRVSIGFAATGTMNCRGSVYRARYYDPIRSRFVSEDPIGAAGPTASVYGYVSDSPLAFVDPLGLRELQAYGGAGGTIGSQPFPLVWPGLFLHGEVNVGVAVNLDNLLDTKVFANGQYALMLGLGAIATGGGQIGGGYSSGVTPEGVSSNLTYHGEAGAGWGPAAGGSLDLSHEGIAIAKGQGRGGAGYGLYAAGGRARTVNLAISIRTLLDWLAHIRRTSTQTPPCP